MAMAGTGTRPRARLLAAPLLTAGGVVVATGAAVVAGRLGVSLVPECPLHALTGLWCPLCGGTRAVQALVAGDLGAAAGLNVLVVVAVPVLVVLWLRWTALRASGRAVSLIALSNRAGAMLAAVLLAYMVVRNLPGMEMLTP
ncbi:MAG: DUF2752 domain-containing protein [Acidimicrobiales bacterium]|jgi:hypothetical protein|nr:DUF2752 domain-containing protein [Acidimicrobiales bacterium]